MPPPYSGKGFGLKKKAFTLAETLITLAIIGVIAALTVPNLIAKYENEQNYVLLRKYQSVLANAFALVTKEEGPTGSWGLRDNDTSSTMQVMEYLSKQVKTEKICRNTPGCWAQTKSLNKRYPNGGTTGIGGATVTARLSSGANIMIDIWATGVFGYYGVNTTEAAPVIWVDVNGDKGPNIAGRDAFAFVLDGTTLKPAGADNNSQSCYVANTSDVAGYQCAYKVIKEHGIKY